MLARNRFVSIGWGQERAMHGAGSATGGMTVGRRLLLTVVLAGMFCVLAAGAASAATPQRSLAQARSAMLTIAKHAHSHSVKSSANDAATGLAIAAFSQLWSNPGEVV